MSITPIRTKTDYKNALKRIDQLIIGNPQKGTREFDELDVLGTLVAAYEDIHYPIQAPSAVETLKYIMEEKGLKAKDLVPYFGSKSVVSEFLNHKRTLSLTTIKALHDAFGLPYETLIS